MIPLKDENPTRSFAVVTLLLIAACAVIYFFVQPTGQGTFLAKTEDRRATSWSSRSSTPPSRARSSSTGRSPRTRSPDTFNLGDTSACDDNPELRGSSPDKNVWLAVLFSMFLHGSLLHIAGNMLYLWIFGNNIEDVMGKVAYIGLLPGGWSGGDHRAHPRSTPTARCRSSARPAPSRR